MFIKVLHWMLNAYKLFVDFNYLFIGSMYFIPVLIATTVSFTHLE